MLKATMKISSKQNGFGAVETLLVLVAVGFISITGWYLWHTKHSADKPIAAGSSSSEKTKTQPPTVNNKKLPVGWQEYSNTTYGVRFGYPSEWGQLKGATGDQSKALLSLYTDNINETSKEIQGNVSFAIYPANTYTLVTEKYGATIKPMNNGDWQIVDVNPASESKYKIGDTYDLQTKQKVNGGFVYILTSADEGCTFKRYIFILKDNYGELSIPALCSQDAVAATNQAEYDTITSNITSSVAIHQ